MPALWATSGMAVNETVGDRRRDVPLSLDGATERPPVGVWSIPPVMDGSPRTGTDQCSTHAMTGTDKMSRQSRGILVAIDRESIIGRVGMAQRFHNRHLILAVGIIGAAIAVLIALSWIFWGWLSGGESGSTTIRNIALVVAGPIALALAIWRSLVADSQSKTAQQVLLNERYQKGAEMLGSAILSVRLGGIYALQRLAEEHPEKYHVQIMQLVCAFVRLPTKDQSLETEQAAIEPGTVLGVRPDVEAVMEAINSRSESRVGLERKAEFRLDLRRAELPLAQFLNTDLTSAFLQCANLSHANFAGANLSHAFLDYADLSEAIFSNVSFTRARLVSANLSGALLQDLDLSRASFHRANLSGANLHRANLSDAIFQDASLANAWLDSAGLSGAGFLWYRLVWWNTAPDRLVRMRLANVICALVRSAATKTQLSMSILPKSEPRRSNVKPACSSMDRPTWPRRPIANTAAWTSSRTVGG